MFALRAGSRSISQHVATTCTVGLDHPTQGRTQLFGRNQSPPLTANFAKPSVHMGAALLHQSSCAGKLTGCWASLPCEQTLDELLQEVDGDTVTLALGCGSAYVGVRADGDVFWAGGIPHSLANKLRGRLGGQPKRAAVDYVALGPDDTYYLAFKDGTSWFCVPPVLKEELASAAGRGGVVLLAFAPRGGYFVQYGDGSNTWNGIPASLHNQLSGRMNSMPAGAAAATVEALSIGYGDDDDDCWFVRYADGSWRSRGLPAGACDNISRLRSEGRDVGSVVLGEEAWAIRYC